MNKSELTNAIKTAITNLNLKQKKILSIGELEQIAKTANCDMFYVMKFLRYGKI